MSRPTTQHTLGTQPVPLPDAPYPNCARTWLPPGRSSGAWKSTLMPAAAGRSLSRMRKALNPTAWAVPKVNPASSWPTNVEPMQAANQSSLPADKAEPLGARNSWLIGPEARVPGREARQGQFIQTTNVVRVQTGEIAGSGRPVGGRYTTIAGNSCQRLASGQASLKCGSRSPADGSPRLVRRADNPPTTRFHLREHGACFAVFCKPIER